MEGCMRDSGPFLRTCAGARHLHREGVRGHDAAGHADPAAAAAAGGAGIRGADPGHEGSHGR